MPSDTQGLVGKTRAKHDHRSVPTDASNRLLDSAPAILNSSAQTAHSALDLDARPLFLPSIQGTHARPTRRRARSS